MDELADLIGVPFAYGGRGPHALDCYGLIMEIHRRVRGIELPDYKSPTDQGAIAAIFGNQLPLWRSTPRAPGAVVLLRLGRLISHCGFMVDENRMIHTAENAGGVLIQRLGPWEKRIQGFYEYVR